MQDNSDPLRGVAKISGLHLCGAACAESLFDIAGGLRGPEFAAGGVDAVFPELHLQRAGRGHLLRAPAAAAALTFFLLIWIFFDYRSVDADHREGSYRPLHEFSARETETYEYLRIPRENSTIVDLYKRRGNEYVRNGKRLPSHPSKIIASKEIDGEQHVFEPKRDAKNKYQPEPDGSLRYFEEGNPKRSMVDTAPGQVTTYRFGVLLMALILNFGFLIVWFVSLWLLLRFQWSHALGLAFVAWLISLFILPMILTQAEKVRKENLPPPKTTATARQAVEPCGHSLFSHTAA